MNININTNQLFFLIKEKIKNIFILYSLVLTPMWIMFALQPITMNIIGNWIGINPRVFEITELISIFISWLGHGDLNHIINNSVVLFSMLWIIGLIEEKPIKIIITLIFISGLATWILGAPNTVHIGASGLVFALMGYILSAATIGRKFVYLIPIAIFGSGYYYSLYNGLIPKQDVSFAAHFGGFISAIIWVFLTTKKNNYNIFMFFYYKLKKLINFVKF